MSEKLSVRETFRDKVILITGCTGFLGNYHTYNTSMIIGKVVLEKILRSLPEVKKIYVLVRLKVYNMKTTGIERGFADGTDQKRNI